MRIRKNHALKLVPGWNEPNARNASRAASCTRSSASVGSPVRRTAVRLTRDQTDAEDLVQDAALLAFRAFGSFQPGTNFKAWFFRILTNAFYSRHRKTKHDRANVSTEDLPALYLYARTAEIRLHTTEPDPAAAMMDKFDSDQVAEALDALPTEYRVVATLYFIEDFSYQQIAEVVGCPVGTVRSRLHRGRRMLQKSLWRVAQERGIVPTSEGLN